jgi:hypothetical protein
MLAVAAGRVLWLLRLCVAPGSTLVGFRAWVLEECPVAPGRRAPHKSGRSGQASHHPLVGEGIGEAEAVPVALGQHEVGVVQHP